jgi:hypothetical protein
MSVLRLLLCARETESVGWEKLLPAADSENCFLYSNFTLCSIFVENGQIFLEENKIYDRLTKYFGIVHQKSDVQFERLYAKC